MACTQEAPLFRELAEQTEGSPSLQERPIRFVNIRETGGWSKDARGATPKMAALLAAAALPDPDPVPEVVFRSAGRALVIGGAAEAERAAAMLDDKLDVSILLSQHGGALAQAHDHAVHAGAVRRCAAGSARSRWSGKAPTRSTSTCARAAMPASRPARKAPSASTTRSTSTAAATTATACASARRRAPSTSRARRAPTPSATTSCWTCAKRRPSTCPAPPQGYFHVPPQAAPQRLFDAVLELRELTGEFDKPTFFRYERRLCAHSRNELTGCTACLDVCSAHAIPASHRQRAQGARPPAACAWSRTCAWAAGRAPRCARAAR